MPTEWVSHSIRSPVSLAISPTIYKHIIKSITKHSVQQAGKHMLRFRVLEPGIVLEKILINTGGLKPSYLGAPESEILH